MQHTLTPMDQDSFAYAPIFPAHQDCGISICVVIRKKPDPAAGWFVSLFKLPDANVFLGCLCDWRKQVKSWLEIWVQTTDGNRGHSLSRAQLNNSYLDQRWRERSNLLEQLTPEAVFAGPWQEEHYPPLYFSLDSLEPVNPCDPKAGEFLPWTLCQDDSVLKKAGLPAYSETVFRYLYSPSLGVDSSFIALDEQAPNNSRVIPAGPDSGFLEDWIPFNPAGGLLFVRKFCALSLRDFKRLLEGYGWQGMGQGLDKPLPSPAYEAYLDYGYFQNNHGLFFSGRKGREGRVVECFLLKLLLFHEALSQVCKVIQQEGLPFLNLRSEDFRVCLERWSGRLPRIWDFELTLCRTSESIAVEIEGKRSRFFKALSPISTSIYQPKELSTVRQGHGSIRLREFREEEEGVLAFEGTLADVEVSHVGPSDLIQLEFPVRGRNQCFHARPMAEQSLAANEIRFETLPRSVAASDREALYALKGVPIEGVNYQIQPIASSPCDLYAMAVTGLEIMIDNEKTSLAVALDECLSFARQISLKESSVPFAERREHTLEEEPRFWNSLGPQNLCREILNQEEASSLIPNELWWEFFEIVIRMFPGGRDSWARDLGDVNPFALDSCFLEAVEQLERLIERTRSLLFIDWTSNRELRNILDEFTEGES